MTPSVVSHYRILRSLGQGGMGQVFLAADLTLKRQVAIKLLVPRAASDPVAGRRMLREAQAAARLDHPNICAVYEVGEHEGQPFIVMPFLEGQTLADRLKGRPLGVGDALALAVPMARALAEAHAKGVVHRDFKPQNVMLTTRAEVKVVDFGLAHMLRDSGGGRSEVPTESRLTDAAAITGTIGYMSPEQARGEAVDARSDIFSLGVVLYEMVTGRHPFAAASSAETLLAVLAADAEPLSRHGQTFPDELERIVRKALRRSRDERYQTARDLALDLERLNEVRADASAPRPEQVPPRSARRWIGPVVLGALALAVLLVTVGRGFLRSKTNRGAPVRIESVAVLPLENLSGAAAQDYFADGMTEALITELAKIHSLRVTSRTSSVSAKKSGKPLPDIARELGVDALVEGSVIREGDRVRITAQLIEGTSDRHIWAESYERDAGDTLALQREVALAIAREVRAQVTPKEASRLASSRTVVPEAIEALLRGRYFFNQGSNRWDAEGKQRLQQSIDSYQEALRLEPRFAEAWAALAHSYHWWASIGEVGLYPKAKAAAIEALKIDDTLAEAHVALAFTVWRSEWDWAGAERSFRRALELNPNKAHHGYALFLSFAGRHTEAVEHIRLAQQLDPLSLSLKSNVAWVYEWARLYDQALEQRRHFLAVAPPEMAVETRSEIGQTLVLMKRCPEGLSELREAARAERGDPAYQYELAWGLALCGAREEAERLLGRLRKAGDKHPVGMVVLLGALGRRDEAFARLEEGFAHRKQWLVVFPTSPRLDPLRADPRFAGLVRRIGIPPSASP